MHPEKHREIASKGGHAAQAGGRCHVFTSEEARAAGKKGGAAILAKRGPGYFAEIGRRGGQGRARNANQLPFDYADPEPDTERSPAAEPAE
jgi:general stress protein YciG